MTCSAATASRSPTFAVLQIQSVRTPDLNESNAMKGSERA